LGELEIRVGKRIKELRKRKNLVQKSIPINRSHLSSIENGEVSLSLDTLQKIADALGVDPQELLSREDVG
jgi:transcriptional regulator with XRE-family HTH domain